VWQEAWLDIFATESQRARREKREEEEKRAQREERGRKKAESFRDFPPKSISFHVFQRNKVVKKVQLEIFIRKQLIKYLTSSLPRKVRSSRKPANIENTTNYKNKLSCTIYSQLSIDEAIISG